MTIKFHSSKIKSLQKELYIYHHRNSNRIGNQSHNTKAANFQFSIKTNTTLIHTYPEKTKSLTKSNKGISDNELLKPVHTQHNSKIQKGTDETYSKLR